MERHPSHRERIVAGAVGTLACTSDRTALVEAAGASLSRRRGA